MGGEQLEAPVGARGQNESSTPHESIAAAQDTPQQAPCKIEYVGYDPVTRGQKQRKQNSNFTRSGASQCIALGQD